MPRDSMNRSMRPELRRAARALIVSIACCTFLALQPGCGRSDNVGPSSGAAATRATDRDVSGASKQDGTRSKQRSDAAALAGTGWDGPVGIIEGAVRFVGREIPRSTVIVNGTDSQVCGSEISKRDVEISPETRGVANVLVWLEDVPLPVGYQPPRQDIVLDNRNCLFEPHAAAITLGSTIEAKNSDETFHTTKLSGAASENIVLAGRGSSKATKARRVGTIAVRCDKHSWMQAFVRVDAHPFHAVTDRDGRFHIAAAPVGTYKINFWHERFLGQDQSVTIRAGEIATLSISYPKDDDD